jgi:hypothetical protein
VTTASTANARSVKSRGARTTTTKTNRRCGASRRTLGLTSIAKEKLVKGVGCPGEGKSLDEAWEIKHYLDATGGRFPDG